MLAAESAKLLKQKHDKPFLLVTFLTNPHDICYQAIREFASSKLEHDLLAGGVVEVSTMEEAMRLLEGLDEDECLRTVCPPVPANFDVQRDEPAAVRELQAQREFKRRARAEWGVREWRMHRWTYAQLTKLVDSQIGQVFDALEEAGIADSTVIIFTSDGSRRTGDRHAAWFIETDSNGESLYVRQAYFVGQFDPCKSLKTTFKAEINEAAMTVFRVWPNAPIDRQIQMFKRPRNCATLQGMSEAGFVLAHPPIVEAVLDIECDLPPTQELNDLEHPAFAQFRDNYPNIQKQFVQEYELRAAAGVPPDFSSQPGQPKVASLQFLQEDKKQLVQVRAQGFSFNRLAPYAGFDEYSEEIRRRWEQYCTIAAPIQVKTINLRYINRIPLPTEDGHVELEEYLKVAPRVPGEQELTLSGFLQQYAVVEGKTGHRANIVLTPQRLDQGKIPIILDIAASADEKGDPQDWQRIMTTIRALRRLKNDIFQWSLTDKCLELFR